MSKQYNKTEKRARRHRYVKRKSQAAKLKPAAAPAAAACAPLRPATQPPARGRLEPQSPAPVRLPPKACFRALVFGKRSALSHAPASGECLLAKLCFR